MGHKIGLALVMTIVLISISTAVAFADSEWKSDYRVGILNQESNSLIPIKVNTFSTDSLKIDWEPPEIQKNEIITGYKILRKDLNSNYRVIIENTNSKNSSYIDKNLPDGYYAYKVIPVIEKQKPDRVTMHGIERFSNIFETYKKGQEILAKKVWNSEKIQSELPDSKSIEFKGIDRMNNPVLQMNITDETFKAKQLFAKLFAVRANH